jgi:hypothetical protein
MRNAVIDRPLPFLTFKIPPGFPGGQRGLSVARALAIGALSLASSRAHSQSNPSLAVPPGLAAANADRSFPGLWEPLEAGAVLVRANDPAAVWYNPAGIVMEDRSAIAANAPGYEVTAFGGTSYNRPAQGSSFRGLPSFVGAVLGGEVIPWRNVRLAIGLSNPISWRQGLSVSNETAPGQRSVYSVSSEVESFQAVGAIAYAPLPQLRLGLSIGMSYDTISSQSQSNAELTTTTAYTGSLNYASISANTQQLVTALGVQYQPADWLGLGLVLRPPSVRILGSTSFSYDGVLNTTEQQQAHVQTGGSFEFRQPLQVNLGITTHFDNLNIELDLFWHAGSGTYTLFGGYAPVRVVTATSGGAPVVSTVSFPDVVTGTRSHLNGSLGGNLKLSDKWWIHGGFYIDQSPYNVNDAFFQAIDFYGVRAGVSLRQPKGLEGSFGMGYELGISNRAPGIGIPLDGVPPSATGSLNIHTFSILLAIGYRF